MKEKGFTLIELLAVIVILAIIALIATPIVLNIIKESKESSQLRSAEFYLGAVETAVTKKIMCNSTFKLSNCEIQKDGNLKCDEVDVIVEIEGEVPNSGTITLKDGKIEKIKLKYENNKVIGYDKNKKLVYFKSTSYQEGENIEIPDLYNNILTPVIYDGDNWRVADVTKKWYDYSKQEWANAVILDSSVKKEIGDTITVDGTNPDALAMFVWIPRYEYKIEGTYGNGGTSTSSPGEIEVNFINKDVKEAKVGYRIHPAFNFGGEDISGIWVGKFEISHKTKDTSLGCTTEICVESDGLIILPNVKSLRNNNVSSFFYVIRSMSKEGNMFGIDKNTTDTHMIKNSEWGSVAYLSQSKYGKYGNSNYEGLNKEVYINNSSNMYTGRSGGTYGGNVSYDLSGTYTYDGYLVTNKEIRNMKLVSSTTGNIYGIYDMSGGAWEYVMGSFANSDGEKWANNSGFVGKATASATDVEGLKWPAEKYYEIYKASSGTTISSTTACNGGVCYGRALSETVGWYGDRAFFVSSTNPWLVRGGYYEGGAASGVFGSASNYGYAYRVKSTRVVLTPAT